MKSTLLGSMLMSFSFFIGAFEIPDDHKITFLLPINWSEAEKINLKVSIPDNFRSIQPPSTWADDSTIIEFIPKDQTAETWTEIITLQKIIGKGFPADEALKFIKEAMVKESKNSKVWDENVFREDDYMEATLGLSYDYNNRREVIGSHYFSGPYDCVGVQYTIYQKDKSSEDKIIEKIDRFFQNQLEIVTDNGRVSE